MDGPGDTVDFWDLPRLEDGIRDAAERCPNVDGDDEAASRAAMRFSRAVRCWLHGTGTERPRGRGGVAAETNSKFSKTRSINGCPSVMQATMLPAAGFYLKDFYDTTIEFISLRSPAFLVKDSVETGPVVVRSAFHIRKSTAQHSCSFFRSCAGQIPSGTAVHVPTTARPHHHHHHSRLPCVGI